MKVNDVLTKNSDVKVLKVLCYLCVDLGTIREVNSKNADFTAVFLHCTRESEYVGM